MPRELINGILIKGDPLAPHPGALVSDSLLCGQCISIELHDYFWIILSHGCRKLSLFPPGNFLLDFSILPFPQLDPPLLEERPTLNCLKLALVFLTPEPMSIKLHIHLWAALEPSLAASFLALLVGSFFGAISYEDTFTKLVCMKYQ